MENLSVQTALVPLLQNEVIHCHLLTELWQVVVFKKARNEMGIYTGGRWGSVSGRVEIGEWYVDTSVREVGEETQIRLSPDQVIVTDFSFTALSRSGEAIHITSCFAVLDSFNLADITFNGELVDKRLLSFEDALDLLKKDGLPGAWESLAAVLGM